MTVLAKTATAFLLLFFLSTSPSTADIKSIKIRSDNRPTILFEKFGFTHTGRITVAVSSVSVTSTVSQPDPSSLGFFLLSEESLTGVLHEIQQNPYFCILRSRFISLLFTFRDLSPPPQSSFNRSYPVTYPNEYSLFFANCNPESLVSMDVNTELFNTLNMDDGATKIYLSVGITQLPSLYFIFSVVYLCFLGFWIFMCFKNLRSVHHVHLLMAVLLLMKSIGLFCAAVEKHYVNVTGTPHGWNVLFYIFQFISNILSVAVIVVIGAGWPYLKPVLQRKEKTVLTIVIALQVLANVVSIVICETGPSIVNWVTWNQLYLLADVICCCAIIFPFVWSLRSISRTDAKAAGNLKAYRVLCVLIIGYLLITRFGVFALKIVADYNHMWVSIAAVEISGVVLYLVMFYMFRPIEDYVIDDEGEYEEAAEILVKG